MVCEGLFEELTASLDASTAHPTSAFSLVSNSASGVCSFASGQLAYRPAGTTGEGASTLIGSTTLEGEADQLFSDRRSKVGAPFDASRHDVLGLQITLAPRPKVRLQLKSWGDRYTSFVPECQNGFLVGTAEGVLYTLSLRTIEHPG